MTTLGQCDGLEKTGFGQFSFYGGVMVLKGLILDNLYFERVVGCENTNFGQFILYRGYGGL